MNKTVYITLIALFISAAVSYSQIDPTNWPPNTGFDQEIHFWSADGFLTIPSGSGGLMVENLQILTGGDQVTSDVTIAGLPAKKSVSTYFNIADDLNFVWIDHFEIDVLILYFADQQSVRDNGFLVGTLPGSNLKFVPITWDRVSDQFEWRLFRIDNADGKFGDIVDETIGGSQFGGVNGGTLRIENASNLVIRAIAFAPGGTFGNPEDINLPPSESNFDPDLYSNLAVWDIDAGVTDGLDVHIVSGGDQEAVIADNIGPAGDQRRAVRPAFSDGQDGTLDNFLNWTILNEHFGPSSQPAAQVKVCVQYYDDPAAVGTVFGPEAYTGPGGAISFFPAAQRVTLEGTGTWREKDWIVENVKFNGVNVPTQAAARFAFTNPVFISQMRLGVFRAGGVNEGIDPIPDCSDFNPDPYQILAEWDIDNNIENGIALAGSGGDQEWIIDGDVGPANDRRFAVRPALDLGTDPFDRYINWTIQNEWFGPSSQPNAVFKVCVEYYDDPALAGLVFGPDVYQSARAGTPQLVFVGRDRRVTLEGTGRWRTFSWTFNDMNFTGVNSGGQGAARIQFDDTAPVYISNVKFGVVRSKGQNAGVDPLVDCGENVEPGTNVLDWELRN